MIYILSGISMGWRSSRRFFNVGVNHRHAFDVGLHRSSYRQTVGGFCARRSKPLTCSIIEPQHCCTNDDQAEGDWNNLADLKQRQLGVSHLVSRGVRTISYTIYIAFDAERYAASMVSNDIEYSAPHSIMTRRIGYTRDLVARILDERRWTSQSLKARMPRYKGQWTQSCTATAGRIITGGK